MLCGVRPERDRDAEVRELTVVLQEMTGQRILADFYLIDANVVGSFGDCL